MRRLGGLDVAQAAASIIRLAGLGVGAKARPRHQRRHVQPDAEMHRDRGERRRGIRDQPLAVGRAHPRRAGVASDVGQHPVNGQPGERAELEIDQLEQFLLAEAEIRRAGIAQADEHFPAAQSARHAPAGQRGEEQG